jgi:NADPH-dependent ferric siderophore reductase
VREAVLPSEPSRPLYAWNAGESGRVKTLRRHLVNERGIERSRVSFTGYRRQGISEDQVRAEEHAEALAEEAAQAEGGPASA